MEDCPFLCSDIYLDHEKEYCIIKEGCLDGTIWDKIESFTPFMHELLISSLFLSMEEKSITENYLIFTLKKRYNTPALCYELLWTLKDLKKIESIEIPIEILSRDAKCLALYLSMTYSCSLGNINEILGKITEFGEDNVLNLATEHWKEAYSNYI